MISVISPVYQAEGCVAELCRRVDLALGERDCPYELILVDDGSRDSSWKNILHEAQCNPSVKGVRLSRNFGQHRAITAGLSLAQGDIVVVMDCDLQDPPEEIPKLVEAVLSGQDVVLVKRQARQDGFAVRAFSRVFNNLMCWLAEDNLDPAIGTFSALSSRAKAAFLRIGEYHRHYLWVIKIMGFEPLILSLPHAKRFEGRSSYTFSKKITHAIDGITSQSVRALRFAVVIGLGMSAASAAYLAVVVYRSLTGSIGVSGWASVIATMLLMGGVICCLLGIIGVYLGRIYVEVKRRPLFIVREITEPIGSKYLQQSAAVLSQRSSDA